MGRKVLSDSDFCGFAVNVFLFSFFFFLESQSAKERTPGFCCRRCFFGTFDEDLPDTNC